MQKAAPESRGQVVDWSAKHILYPEGASLRTLALGERDPRAFWNYLRLMSAANYSNGPGGRRHPVRPVKLPQAHTDWSVSLGAAGTAANMFPAKFNFDIAGSVPSCANDYAVFTINTAGSATQANLVAVNNLYSGTTSAATVNISPSPAGAKETGTTVTITIAGAPKLTGPVLDFSTGAGGNIFVGGSNGDLYGFTPAGAAITSSPLTVGNGGTDGGITDAPIVDAVNDWIYVASGNNGANNVVAQASTSSFAAGNVFKQTFGGSGRANVHAGAFNNAYFASGTSTTWFLYVCGARAAGAPGLYQVGFNAARHIASVTREINLSAHVGEQCSPLTEFENNGVDQLFFGLLTTGEVASVNITTPPPTATSATAAEAGGTSGIIVDNVGTLGQESSIYFSTLATGTCATSTIAASPGGATEAANTVTITTTAAHGFGVGESVTIAGVGVAGYNGTQVVTSVPSSTIFTYTDATAGLANSGGGTVTASGFCAVKRTQGALQ